MQNSQGELPVLRRRCSDERAGARHGGAGESDRTDLYGGLSPSPVGEPVGGRCETTVTRTRRGGDLDAGVHVGAIAVGKAGQKGGPDRHARRWAEGRRRGQRGATGVGSLGEITSIE